jgi:hypothetical protein
VAALETSGSPTRAIEVRIARDRSGSSPSSSRYRLMMNRQ